MKRISPIIIVIILISINLVGAIYFLRVPERPLIVYNTVDMGYNITIPRNSTLLQNFSFEKKDAYGNLITVRAYVYITPRMIPNDTYTERYLLFFFTTDILSNGSYLRYGKEGCSFVINISEPRTPKEEWNHFDIPVYPEAPVIKDHMEMYPGYLTGDLNIFRGKSFAPVRNAVNITTGVGIYIPSLLIDPYPKPGIFSVNFKVTAYFVTHGKIESLSLEKRVGVYVSEEYLKS